MFEHDPDLPRRCDYERECFTDEEVEALRAIHGEKWTFKI